MSTFLVEVSNLTWELSPKMESLPRDQYDGLMCTFMMDSEESSGYSHSSASDTPFVIQYLNFRPLFIEVEIDDKSKGDLLSKTLAILHPKYVVHSPGYSTRYNGFGDYRT